MFEKVSWNQDKICGVRMTKALSIGFQNYKPLKDYIVDKTLIIQEFLDMAIDSIELFKDT